MNNKSNLSTGGIYENLAGFHIIETYKEMKKYQYSQLSVRFLTLVKKQKHFSTNTKEIPNIAQSIYLYALCISLRKFASSLEINK